MKTLIIFDSRFANSIACAAIIKLSDRNIPTVDLAQVVAKKEKDNLAKTVKSCGLVYVMVDGYSPKVNKDCEVYYTKAPKSDKNGKRILSVFQEAFPNEKTPLIVYILGKKNLSPEHKAMRDSLKNSLPVYMADLNGSGLGLWNSLLMGTQDVSLLNQMAANGLIIANYKEKFNTGDVASVDLKEFKALEAKVAASVDQSEELQSVSADLVEAEKEINSFVTSSEARSKESTELVDKEKKANAALIKEVEAHDQTRKHLESAKADAASAKATVVSKQKELTISQDSLSKAGPLLEKEKSNHKKTQATLESKNVDLGASKKALTESRSDYDKSQKVIVAQEKSITKLKKDLAKKK